MQACDVIQPTPIIVSSATWCILGNLHRDRYFVISVHICFILRISDSRRDLHESTTVCCSHLLRSIFYSASWW